MFAFQGREFSLPLSSAHRLLQCYHSQWEIGDAGIPGEFPPQPPATRAISQWGRRIKWCHAVTLHILVGKICISIFLFYCEGMLSLVVLWLCGTDCFQLLSVCGVSGLTASQPACQLLAKLLSVCGHPEASRTTPLITYVLTVYPWMQWSEANELMRVGLYCTKL